MQQKAILDEFGKPIKFGYQASRPSWRKNNDFLDRSPITQTEEKVLSHGHRLELLSTLRDLERNNPICKAMVQVFVSNLGNCRFISDSENEELSATKEKLFARYFKNLEISGHGMSRVLSAIITDMLLAGECFIILTKSGAIQLMPSERVGSNHDPATRRDNEMDGFVLNKYGRPTHYRFAQITDGSVDYSKGFYLPAKDVIHIANTSRINQLRGTPLLASAAQTLEDIHTVQAAFTSKVKTSSALTGFITSNQPYSARWDGNEFDEEPMRSTYTKLYQGSLLLLEAGESVETIQGGNIGGVDTFLTQLISFACASVGITVENLVGWSNASFSSSKATRAVTNHRFNQIKEMLEEVFLRRLCKWRCYKYEAQGELPEMQDEEHENFSFQWSMNPTLDRRQDAQTDAIVLENGLASHTTVFAQNGMSFEEEAKRMAKDREILAQINTENTNPEQTNTSTNEDVNIDIKNKIEAYGIGVRGGTITPQEDDEEYFRNLLGLPQPTQPIKSAWEEDGGARRPITLKSQDAFEEEQNQIVDDESISEEEASENQ